jgi:hypothetical protein
MSSGGVRSARARSRDVMSGSDVIGDVHGYAGKLEGLLKELGYTRRKKVWSHPDRQVIFIGDLIDRGDAQRETVDIARNMVDAGSALIVLGNHEFNAIAWATPDPEIPGEFLRSHSRKIGTRNRNQHKKFLANVGEDSALHREYVAWFRSIPLWLDLGELRVIHACWQQSAMGVVTPWLSADGSVTHALMVEGSRRGSAEYEAIEIILKGPEIELPDGYTYLDKDGHPRHRARLRWWDAKATTLRRAAEIPPHSTTLDGQPFPELPDTPLGDGMNAPYTDKVPVLYGHYWRTGALHIDTPLTACVDYSAGAGEKLVAYRWDTGDKKLMKKNLVAFPVV